jgi:hypothetical protein
METLTVPQSFYKSIKTPGDLKNAESIYGRKNNIEDNIPMAVVVDHITGKINPKISHISRGARFSEDELSKLRNLGARNDQISALSELLPCRRVMENALRRKGMPVPPDLFDLTISFYENIIKMSEEGKHFAYVEGNPISYKLQKQNHASSVIVSSLVDIVPAATGFINYAMSQSSSINDPGLLNDIADVKAYLYAKSKGLPTDNIAVGRTSVNPILIGAVVVMILIMVFKR